jgi:transcription elongation factor Elf1
MNKGFKIKCLNCGSENITLIPNDDEYESTIVISCNNCENEDEIYC